MSNFLLVVQTLIVKRISIYPVWWFVHFSMYFLFLLFLFPQYELRLAASDNLKENYTTVVIHVKDVNDNPPVFERPTYRTQITEEDDRNLPKRVLQAGVACIFFFSIFLTVICNLFVFIAFPFLINIYSAHLLDNILPGRHFVVCCCCRFVACSFYYY